MGYDEKIWILDDILNMKKMNVFGSFKQVLYDIGFINVDQLKQDLVVSIGQVLLVY